MGKNARLKKEREAQKQEQQQAQAVQRKSKKKFAIFLFITFLLVIGTVTTISFAEDEIFSDEIGRRIDAYPPADYENIIHQVMALGWTPRLEQEIMKIIKAPTKEIPYPHIMKMYDGKNTEGHVGIIPLILVEKLGFDYEFQVSGKKYKLVDLVEGHFYTSDEVLVANAGIENIEKSFAMAHSLWVETGKMTLHEMLIRVMKPEIQKMEMAWFTELMARYLHYKKKPFDQKIAIGSIKKEISIHTLLHSQFLHVAKHVRSLKQRNFSFCHPTEDAAHLYDALITIDDLFKNDKTYKKRKSLYRDQAGMCLILAAKFSQNYEDLEGATGDWHRLGIGVHFLEYGVPESLTFARQQPIVQQHLRSWKKESLEYARELMKQEKKWSPEEHHFMIHVKLWLDAASKRGEFWVKDLDK